MFPGLDLLGMGFEREGYCVVRGPDPVWGGDVHTFHPPPDVFWGIIGGPPCQAHSILRHLNPLAGKRDGDLIPEYVRVVGIARPAWYLMENVPTAPDPVLDGYSLVKRVAQNLTIAGDNGWVGQEQMRTRAFWFGWRDGLEAQPFRIERAVLTRPKEEQRHAVLAGHGSTLGQRRKRMTKYDLDEATRLQGLDPLIMERLPYTYEAKRRLIGNGVPLPMARAVARAVRRALPLSVTTIATA